MSKGGLKKKETKTKPKARQEKKPIQAPIKKEDAGEDAFGMDPEADGGEDAGEEEIKAAVSRPPPVNSDYLPLPWKGRLGYVSGSRAASSPSS